MSNSVEQSVEQLKQSMEQQERFSQQFAQPETFRPGEVEDTIRIEIYTM